MDDSGTLGLKICLCGQHGRIFSDDDPLSDVFVSKQTGLVRLNELLNMDLITKEEFDQVRTEITDSNLPEEISAHDDCVHAMQNEVEVEYEPEERVIDPRKAIEFFTGVAPPTLLDQDLINKIDPTSSDPKTRH